MDCSISVPLILLLLSGLFLLLATRAPGALWGLAFTLPLLAIAVLDFVQKKHSLRRNYPLVARFRWLFEDLRPYLRSYIVESNQDGRPFDKNARALVYARSKNQTSTHPFGTELDVYSDEYEWPMNPYPRNFVSPSAARNAPDPIPLRSSISRR